MPTRCSKCGYSNDPEFRFCGMCGSPMARSYDEPIRLQRPQPPIERAQPEKPQADTQNVRPAESGEASSSYQRSAVDTTIPDRNPPNGSVKSNWMDHDLATQRERTDRALYENGGFDLSPRGASGSSSDGGSRKEFAPVSGPSFLGLEPQQPEPAPSYLYDDESEKGHGRLYLGIILLLAVGGGLFWQWQREGYPWNPPAKPAVASSTEGTDTGDGQSPAANSSSEASAEPSTPAKPEAPVPEASKLTTQPAPAPAKSEPADDAATPDKPAEPVAKAPVPTVPAARKPVREAAPQVETPDPSEALFSDGQRYLYGTGVPENCTLARTKLMAAANQSNPRAQSTVATMYATGHCLPRNLPSAYHWFAQALHKERDNMRLQRDLEMLWNQMTPEEKQVALKSR